MNMNQGLVFTPEEAEAVFAAMLEVNAASGMLGFYRVFLQERSIGLFAMTNDEENNAVELEYMLLPDCWGKGYATVLVSQQLPALRSAFPGRTITAITDPDNRRSIRVLEKNGFRAGTLYTNEDGEPALSFYLKENHP